MPVDLEVMYRKILQAAGGADNISSLGCCMTRLRFTVKDEALVDVAALRKVRDVAGYFYSGVQHQLIVGPSTAGKLAAYFKERHHFNLLEEGSKPGGVKINLQESISQNKAAVKRKYSNKVSAACRRVGNIFLPLIPAYIGCGLIIGITNILSKTALAGFPDVVALLSVLGQSVFFYLVAIVGYNANKEFGGSPALGLAFAGILNMPALANITLFGRAFIPGKGGVLAVLLVCWIGSWVEKGLRKHIKGSSEMFLTPLLTILIVGPLSLAFIQPLAGWAADMLAVVTQFLLQRSSVLVGGILGGFFLPLVMLGVHQSLIPIHQQLMESFGSNPLFPILCMAGAGQVGAALAVLIKTRNQSFKTLIKSALPVGVLGVGEPLIYGVTLPLFKPFVAACIGGAVGGAVVAFFHVASSIPFGVSGVVLLFALSNMHSVIFYLAGYLAAVFTGFICAWSFGFEDPSEVAGNNS